MNADATSDFRSRQKLLISENLLRQALDELLAFTQAAYPGLYSEAIHQKRRLIENETQLHQGVLSDAESNQVFNQISVALLHIADQIGAAQTAHPWQTTTKNLLNRIPNSNSIFVGREQELEEFRQAFERYNFIAIEGVGGIGKTEFAIECVKRCVEDKERVLWVSPTMKFDVMVHQAGYGEMLKIEQLDDFQKFKNFEGLLDRDKRVVVLEDFHDNSDDTYNRFFEQFSLQQAKVLMIARFLPAGLDAPVVIKLEGLGKSALHFAKDERNKKTQYGEISDDDLEKLCKAVEGHPLSIELGVQLLSYGENAEDMVRVFAKGDYQDDKKIATLSQRLLFSVLNNAKTSPAERELLARFSVFRDKVPFEAIAALCDDPIKFPLSQLIEKSLLRYKQKLYDCTPLIREFCVARLENAEDIHRRAAQYFRTHRSAAFDLALEGNVDYHLQASRQWQLLGAEVEEQGKALIKLGQVNLLKDTIQVLKENGVQGPAFLVYEAEIFIHLSDFESARQRIGEALEAYRALGDKRGECVALNVSGRVKWTTNLGDALEALEESYRLAEELADKGLMMGALNLIANNYFEKGNLDNACERAEFCLKLAEELNDKYESGMALNVLGRIHSLKGNFEQALSKLQAAFALFEALGHKILMSAVRNNIGNVLARSGKYDEALKEYDYCLTMIKLIGSRIGEGAIYNSIGYIQIQLGNIPLALEKFNISLKIYEESHHEHWIASVWNYIGLAYSKMKNFEKALESYRKSLAICEKTGYNIGLIFLYESMGELFLNAPVIETEFSENACHYLIKSIVLRKKMKVNSEKSEKLLQALREKLNSFDQFQQLVNASVSQLPQPLRDGFDTNALFQIEPELVYS